MRENEPWLEIGAELSEWWFSIFELIEFEVGDCFWDKGIVFERGKLPVIGNMIH